MKSQDAQVQSIHLTGGMTLIEAVLVIQQSPQLWLVLRSKTLTCGPTYQKVKTHWDSGMFSTFLKNQTQLCDICDILMQGTMSWLFGFPTCLGSRRAGLF